MKTLLEQIAELQSQLTAKEQATLNNENKETALNFENKERLSEDEIKTYIESEISSALNVARETIKNKFQNNDWLETCIDTTKKYIAIGVNFNPKSENNTTDNKYKINVSFRTIGETIIANKQQDKDITKNIKKSSHKKIKAFENSQIDLQSTLDKIAKVSGIKN